MNTRVGATDYLERVRAALADLPADEVADIIEDVEPHLAEIDAEGDSLVDRLGEPEVYAAELRAAAGLPSRDATGQPQPKRPGQGRARFVLWSLVFTAGMAFLAGAASAARQLELEALLPAIVLAVPAALSLYWLHTGATRIAEVTALREYRWVAGVLPERVRAYLASLAPAWRVLRMVLLVLGLLIGFSGHNALGWLLTAAALAAVVLFDRKARTDRSKLWIIVPCSAFAAGIGLMAVGTLLDSVSDRNSGYYSGPAAGMYNNGAYVSNLYAFDENGRLVDPVYLYDQNGQPVDLSWTNCRGDGEPGPRNRFPQPEADPTYSTCVPAPAPSFVPALPKPSAVPPSVSATPSGPAGSGTVSAVPPVDPSVSGSVPPPSPVVPTTTITPTK